MALSCRLPLKGQFGTTFNDATCNEHALWTFQPIGHRIDALRHAHKVVVATIHKHRGAWLAAQIVIQFALGMLDSLKTTKSLQMCPAHIGDQSVLRFHYLHKAFDVARMAGTHLHNGYIMARIEGKEGFGHSHIIIEVALGAEHLILL